MARGWPHVFAAGAYAIVLNANDEVLLGLRHDGQFWMLPGGGIEAGENAEQAVIREVKEETGFDIRLLRLAGVHDRFFDKQQIILTYQAEVVGGDWTPNHEIDKIAWYPLDALPEPMAESSQKRLETFRKSREQTFLLTEK